MVAAEVAAILVLAAASPLTGGGPFGGANHPRGCSIALDRPAACARRGPPAAAQRVPVMVPADHLRPRGRVGRRRRGDVPRTGLQFLSSNCGKRLTDFAVTAKTQPDRPHVIGSHAIGDTASSTAKYRSATSSCGCATTAAVAGQGVRCVTGIGTTSSQPVRSILLLGG